MYWSRVEKVDRIVVGEHVGHFAALEVGVGEAFGPFERNVGLLLGDEIPRAEFVQRRAAAGGRRLNA
jgi:hypothetical protein